MILYIYSIQMMLNLQKFERERERERRAESTNKLDASTEAVFVSVSSQFF
jgi:hypothetical protein